MRVDPILVLLLVVQRLTPMATLVAYSRGVRMRELVVFGVVMWGVSTVMAMRTQGASRRALERGVSDAAWGIARRSPPTVKGGAHDALLALVWRGISARDELQRDKDPGIVAAIIALPILFVMAASMLGPGVALAMLAAAATGVVLRIPIARVYQRAIEESSPRWAVLTRNLGHALRALEDLQAHGLEAAFARELESAATRVASGESSIARWRALAIWAPLVAGGLVFAGGVYLTRGADVALLDLGALAAIAPAVMGLGRALIIRRRLVADAAALDALANAPADLPPRHVTRPLPERLAPIAWEKVTFRYPPPFRGQTASPAATDAARTTDDGPGNLVFDDVTVRWSGNRPLALVGANGSGKSTLLLLLLRLVDPESGVVRVGGEDLRELDPVPLRERVSYVPQRPLLLEGMTVGEAMRLTAPGANDETLLAALDRVGLGRELRSRKDSPLAVRCAALSAGQAQRVAVARALARDARVFVLDEPEAALDPAARRDLRRLLEELAGSGHLVLLATQHEEVVPSGAARLELPLARGVRVEL